MDAAGADFLLAFASGLLSVMSPCVLPLMPAYLSLISGISVDEMQDREAVVDGRVRRRVLRACVGFVSGFSAIFILMGVGAVAVGQVVRTWRLDLLGFEVGVSQIAGVAVIGLGLHMMGLSPISLLYRDTRRQFHISSQSFLSAAVVGAGFALGWSPCIGPILAGILAVAGHRETIGEGVALLAVYSAGLAIPFLIAGFSIDYFFHAYSRIKQHFRKLELASGAILVAVGGLLVTGRLSALNSQFSFMLDWINAAEQALQ
jgi:cytochrome c-type biogenesis protein